MYISELSEISTYFYKTIFYRHGKILKLMQKKKQAQLNKSLRGTGGGPSTARQIDKLSETIVGIIGEVPISGDPLIAESTVSFDFGDESNM